jgi:hypothetical protein
VFPSKCAYGLVRPHPVFELLPLRRGKRVAEEQLAISAAERLGRAGVTGSPGTAAFNSLTCSERQPTEQRLPPRQSSHRLQVTDQPAMLRSGFGRDFFDRCGPRTAAP